MRNIVFIGTSLDGYIADKNGGLEFLQSVPNPENDQLDFPSKCYCQIILLTRGSERFCDYSKIGFIFPVPSL